jgi:hypothetical protein
VFRGIARAAQDLNCNLLLGCGMGPSASLNDPPRPVWPILSLEEDFAPIGPWNTDGIIVINPLHSTARSDYVKSLIQGGSNSPQLAAKLCIKRTIPRSLLRVCFIRGLASGIVHWIGAAWPGDCCG